MAVSGTPGTGTITLGAAVAGFRSFAAAGVANGDVVNYVAEDGTAWEYGRGTYTVTGTTLSRTLIGSSTGALLALSSAATILSDVFANDVISMPAFKGFGIARNGTTPATQIDIAKGFCLADDDMTPIRLPATITKSIASVWAVGSGSGGLDTGVKAVSTTYHLWAIRRPDTGVVDVLFSASATAPTMPANYTAKAYLWPVMTDASGNFRDFVQHGNEFLWNAVPIQDVAVTNPGTAAVLRTLTVPTGIKVEALYISFTQCSATTSAFASVSSPDVVDNTIPSHGLSTASAWTYSPGTCRTNTSGQIRHHATLSDASTVYQLYTKGYKFYREAY